MATLFGDEERFEAGLQEVAPGIHAWMQPNGAWGESNAGLVAGEGESLLVDTLWDLGLTGRMLEAMVPVTADARIVTLVNTHGDGDHWWGNQLVGADEIVATEAAAKHEMKSISPGGMGALTRLGDVCSLLGRGPVPRPARSALRATAGFFVGWTAPFDFSNIELTPPTRTFSGRLDLEVGGRRIELIEVGPAHTQGDLIVHVPDARVVFAADIVFLGSTPVMWAGPVENWLAALDTIAELGPSVVVPGHGPITDVYGLAPLREYWTYLAAASRRRLATNGSATGAAKEIVHSAEYGSKPFAGWDCPERAVINVNTLARKGGEPSPIRRLRILSDVGRLAAELPGARPAALHPQP